MFPTRIGAQHVWHIEQGKIQQLRDDGVKAGEVPTVSFDFAYTRAVGAGGNVNNTEQVIALILVDSQTNFTGCIPIQAKSQFDLMGDVGLNAHNV